MGDLGGAPYLDIRLVPVPSPARNAGRGDWQTAGVWTCPDCSRRFGRVRQGHECAPALTLEEYFSTGPEREHPIFEAVHAHLRDLGDVYVEPVSVGIFFKVHTTFCQLRPMTKWVALSFFSPQRIDHPRISRKPAEYSGRWHHVVNVRDAGEIDRTVKDWLTEAYDLETSSSSERSKDGVRGVGRVRPQGR